jgi:hypothetical protein
VTDDIKPCPDCETDILVTRSSRRDWRFECQACGRRFGATDVEWLPYGAADTWYVVVTHFGSAVHTSRTCIPPSSTVETLTPEEARAHDYGRCGTCAVQVTDTDDAARVDA